MGGWSGGVYTRFRNWATDKANSINPQAANFDQEDDGFAAGLNNCVTKDGLNKPTAPMDWNGQSLSAVLNFTNTGSLTSGGAVSLVGGKLTVSVNGNVILSAPVSGVAATLNAVNSQYAMVINTNAKSGIQLVGSLNSSAGIDLVDGNAGNQLWSIASGYPVTGAFGIATTAGAIAFSISPSKVCQILDDSGTLQVAGYRGTPIDIVSALPYTLVATDRGRNKKITAASGTLTVPANIFTAGDVVVLSAFSGTSAFTIAQGASMNMYLGGSGLTTGNRTLTSVGMVTIEFLDATNCIIQGSGLS